MMIENIIILIGIYIVVTGVWLAFPKKTNSSTVTTIDRDEKPRIRKAGDYWRCDGWKAGRGHSTWIGDTPKDAYLSWYYSVRIRR